MGTEGLVGDRGWRDDDHVRVAEYFEAEDIDDELLMFDGSNGQAQQPSWPRELRKVDPKSPIFDDPMTRKAQRSKARHSLSFHHRNTYR